MKMITLIAVGCMTFWFAGDAIAQQGKKGQQNPDGQQQLDNENGKQGQRVRRGGRGQRGQQNGNNGDSGMRRQRDPAQMLDAIYNRFDTDKNGSISLTEAPERMQQRFEAIDANGDMSISREELTAMFGNRRGQQAGAGEGKQQGAGAKRNRGERDDRKEGQGKKGARKQMDVSQLIERADTNKDGAISIEEAPDRMKQRFEQLDADSSGTITAEEMKTAFEKMRSRTGKGRAGKGGARGRSKADRNDSKSPQPNRPPMTDDGV